MYRIRRLALLLLAGAMISCGTPQLAAPDSPLRAIAPFRTAWSANCTGWLAAIPLGPADPDPAVERFRYTDLYPAGAAVVPVEETYAVVYFPPLPPGVTTQRVLVNLHGTDGAPEWEWRDWKPYLDARGWGFIGLNYHLPHKAGSGDANYEPDGYATDATIYRQLTQVIGKVEPNCQPTKYFLEGFSRGSAQTFAVMRRDKIGAKHFSAAIANAGAWPPKPMPDGLLPPTLSAIDGLPFSMSGTRFWLYSGEADRDHGWPMPTEMDNAATWVRDHAGRVARHWIQPGGSHGSFVATPAAVNAAMSFCETL